MTTSRVRAALLASLLVSVLALSACGDDPDAGAGTPGPTPAASPTATPTPSPDGTEGEETAAPPFPADSEPDVAETSGTPRLGVTDVRAARHEGYDRVVLELDGSGEGTPGWRVEYVEEAVDDGSGNPVEVDGDTVLRVVLSGTAMPMDSGVEEWAGERLSPPDTVAVREVVFRHVFEGYTTSFVGLAGEPRPFRVFLLEDPVRVVVDIQH